MHLTPHLCTFSLILYYRQGKSDIILQRRASKRNLGFSIHDKSQKQLLFACSSISFENPYHRILPLNSTSCSLTQIASKPTQKEQQHLQMSDQAQLAIGSQLLTAISVENFLAFSISVSLQLPFYLLAACTCSSSLVSLNTIMIMYYTLVMLLATQLFIPIASYLVSINCKRQSWG